VRKDSESIRRLLATIASSTLPGRGSAAPQATTVAAPPAAAPAPAAPSGPDAKAFPMEDAAPGQEPPK
jgi:hypothetical protein